MLAGMESQEASEAPFDEVGTVHTSVEEDTETVDRRIEIVEEND